MGTFKHETVVAHMILIVIGICLMWVVHNSVANWEPARPESQEDQIVLPEIQSLMQTSQPLVALDV